MIDNSYVAFVLTVDNKYRCLINGILTPVTFPLMDKSKLDIQFKFILHEGQKFVGENWMTTGGSIMKIHCEVQYVLWSLISRLRYTKPMLPSSHNYFIALVLE